MANDELAKRLIRAMPREKLEEWCRELDNKVIIDCSSNKLCTVLSENMNENIRQKIANYVARELLT